MNTRIARLAIAGLLFAAGCSGSDDGGSATDPTDSTGDTPTTVEGSVGAAVPAGVNWTESSLSPPVDLAPAVPSFAQVTATAGVPAAPPGFPYRQSDYTSELFIIGDTQFVTGSCGCWEGGGSGGVFGGLRTPIYLFRSVDAGATWAQVDLSSVLGDVNGRINTIVEHEGVILATATTSDAAGNSPTVINVIRSADGAAWERVSTIAGDNAVGAPVHAFDLYTLGSSLVLYGGDQACSFDGSSAIQNIGPTYQTRLWTSTDSGATWLPQSPVDSGLDGGRPPLPDEAACRGLGFQDIMDAYGSAPRLITQADDRLMVWSADGQSIASSADGTTWSTATLDGATALPSERVPEPEASTIASAILSFDGEFVAMNLENYRNIDDTATGLGVGMSVITWTSADGATWLRQPVGRPIVTIDYSANYQFFVTADGLALRVYNRLDHIEFGMLESVAGQEDDWTTCVPAADANCAFATEVGEFEPGADLSGIDLSYASIEGRDLTGVSFEGAVLRSTNTAEATIDGTNFDGATLTSIKLIGDLASSTFVDATLDRVTFSTQFFTLELVGATISSPIITIDDAGLPAGLSFVGRDLTGYSFSNGTLAGVDFSGANLTNASFSYTDLTGAVFAGAVLDTVFFYDVTCPDGQPTTVGEYGAASCRL